MTNNDFIITYYGLIKSCVYYQLKSASLSFDFTDDLIQHVSLTILEYDNDKLNDVHNRNHANAFITRIIQNNIRSTTSRFYYQFRKFLADSKQIDSCYEMCE